MNAPRTWPNSSLSSSSPGSAATFTATNGPLRRGEWAWMIRAITSLPVPLSPVTSTEASLYWRLSTRRITRPMARERQMRPLAASGPEDSTCSSSAGRSTTR